MHRKLLLFDFDGVIFDSFDAMAPLVTKHWGTTAEEQRAVHDKNVFAMDDATPEEVAAEEGRIAAFYAEADRVLPEVCPVFPGVRAVLPQLAVDYRLFVVSSSWSSTITKVLDRCGLAHCFSGIYGMENERSKVKKIHTILAAVGKHPRESLFITDTLGDVREARTAGVDAIAVTWGFHDRERVLQGEPWGICDHPTELPVKIATYFGDVSP